jgi:hypothetical protein
MYKNNFDYIINPRLVSVLFSRLRRVLGANRSIITRRRKEKGMKKKKKRKRRNGKKLASMHVLHLSIYFCIEGEQKIDDREREGERNRKRETQHNIAADAASASSHHSVCLCLDEKQQ